MFLHLLCKQDVPVTSPVLESFLSDGSVWFPSVISTFAFSRLHVYFQCCHGEQKKGEGVGAAGVEGGPEGLVLWFHSSRTSLWNIPSIHFLMHCC